MSFKRGMHRRESDKNVNFYKVRNQMCHIAGLHNDKTGFNWGFLSLKQPGTEPAAYAERSVDGFFNFKE